MNKVYWGWYKCIEDDASDKAIKVEAEIEIKIRDWGMQRFEGLLYLIRKLELNI